VFPALSCPAIRFQLPTSPLLTRLGFLHHPHGLHHSHSFTATSSHFTSRTILILPTNKHHTTNRHIQSIKMRSFITIAAASLATFAYAMPEPIFGASKLAARDATCMSADEANQVALNFNHLISAYSEELANASLTVGFEDYSDSVISLIDAGCAGPLPVRPITTRKALRTTAD